MEIIKNYKLIKVFYPYKNLDVDYYITKILSMLFYILYLSLSKQFRLIIFELKEEIDLVLFPFHLSEKLTYYNI